MSDKSYQRADDSVLRKIIIGVTIAIFVQAIGWIYMLGNLSNQVANNTKAIGSLASMMEKQRESTSSMVRIETMMEGLTALMNRLSDRIEVVATEQNRRALIIDRADRFMEKNGE